MRTWYNDDPHALDIEKLWRAATEPRGSEDDMYCAQNVPALIVRIRELEAQCES